MRNGIALREIPQNTPIIYAWRLPSLVCEHISYAAWCFSVTCFYNISLSRAWLTNGIQSLICPLLFCFLVWLLIFFFSFFTTYLNDIPHRKTRNGVFTISRGWGCRWDGWMTSWPFWVTLTTHLSICLLIEDVEQMLCLLKRTIVDGTFIWKYEKRKSLKCNRKGSYFGIVWPFFLKYTYSVSEINTTVE